MTASPFERNCDNLADRPLAPDLGGAHLPGPQWTVGQACRQGQGSAPLPLPILAQCVHIRLVQDCEPLEKARLWNYFGSVVCEGDMRAVELGGDCRIKSPLNLDFTVEL